MIAALGLALFSIATFASPPVPEGQVALSQPELPNIEPSDDPAVVSEPASEPPPQAEPSATQAELAQLRSRVEALEAERAARLESEAEAAEQPKPRFVRWGLPRPAVA